MQEDKQGYGICILQADFTQVKTSCSRYAVVAAWLPDFSGKSLLVIKTPNIKCTLNFNVISKETELKVKEYLL